ncbi:hypothetical protein [Streptomyces sp. bgisy100]|uniref:hypothetical protein n=1 Tax=Streptomyces sp. bgisy100 TaxID=3413783 RepID=UPI003D75F85F
MTRSRLLPALTAHEPVTGAEPWTDFWDRLESGATAQGEALAVLASLSTALPDAGTLDALLRSLDARAPRAGGSWSGTVNVVGTGGGPPTFNLSTAACLVAAAAGARVVKSGSRGYTSRYGSVDILERLGVPLAGSYPECEDMLERYGVVFAGPFVYPRELTLLARGIMPFGIKQVGRAVNTLGPFLPRLPVTAQLTGVADPRVLPVLTELAALRAVGGRQLWLVHNGLGVDELVSFAENRIGVDGGAPRVLAPEGADFGPGTLADLAPAAEGTPPGPQLRELLAGRGPRAAVESIRLNAAAAAVASGAYAEWSTALDAARDAMASGAAVDLVERLRAHRAAPPAVMVHG